MVLISALWHQSRFYRGRKDPLASYKAENHPHAASRRQNASHFLISTGISTENSSRRSTSTFVTISTTQDTTQVNSMRVVDKSEVDLVKIKLLVLQNARFQLKAGILA